LNSLRAFVQLLAIVLLCVSFVCLFVFEVKKMCV
jgi:hypothetical protein